MVIGWRDLGHCLSLRTLEGASRCQMTADKGQPATSAENSVERAWKVESLKLHSSIFLWAAGQHGKALAGAPKDLGTVSRILGCQEECPNLLLHNAA